MMKMELRVADLLAREGKEFTINEAARQLHGHYSFVHRIVNRLEKDGVVKKRKAGKAYLCSLNFSEKAMVMLKLAELEKRDELYKRNKQLKLILEDFLKLLESKVMSAVLFGSYSKGTEMKESDIDILLIMKGRADIDKAVREIYAKYGREISAINMRESEFANQAEKPIIKEIIKDHHVIFGAEKFVDMAFG
jgi:predicted nucleotidyltransferase